MYTIADNFPWKPRLKRELNDVNCFFRFQPLRNHSNKNGFITLWKLRIDGLSNNPCDILASISTYVSQSYIAATLKLSCWKHLSQLWAKWLFLTGAERSEWMGMGLAGITINNYYGSFPHSLLSTSKIFTILLSPCVVKPLTAFMSKNMSNVHLMIW